LTETTQFTPNINIKIILILNYNYYTLRSIRTIIRSIILLRKLININFIPHWECICDSLQYTYNNFTSCNKCSILCFCVKIDKNKDKNRQKSSCNESYLDYFSLVNNRLLNQEYNSFFNFLLYYKNTSMKKELILQLNSGSVSKFFSIQKQNVF
jgi:hypothetical protein